MSTDQIHPEAQARMVDVTSKETTVREATAAGTVQMAPETVDKITSGTLDKGNALEVARIAGIMGAKRTSELIPLCHPIGIGAAEVELLPGDDGLSITSTVRTTERTGVEMEALTAVTVAALTIYDMVKGIDRDARITDVRLLRKSGGRSGDWSAS